MASRLPSEQVYQALRKEIIEGDLSPGTRLATRALSQRFGLSDIPVREALWMLARDGLVENTPYAGARVRQFTDREVAETYAVRGHLESLALKLGAGRLDGQQIAAVERLLDQLQEALEAGDFVAYGRLNRLFHAAVLVGCPNSRLLELIDNLWDGQASFQMVFRLNPERARMSQAEHREIAAAVISGDGERAAELITTHGLRSTGALSNTALTSMEAEEQAQ